MRRLRRSTKQYLIIVSLSLLIIGTAFIVAYVLILKNIEKSYGAQLDALSKEREENRRYVYEAIDTIQAGTYLTEELFHYKEVYTSQNQSTYMEADDFGKVALISIPQGTYVQKSMLLDDKVEDNVREAMFNCIQLANHIGNHDVVDVRIFYPNGENYVVLSKKIIQNHSEDYLQCFLWLSEEEILMMSSAIVDAFLFPGAYLYTTKYVHPTVQEASIVTYQASLSTQELIARNPNIVEIAARNLSENLRKELENRLANSMSNSVEEIPWEVSQEYDKKEKKAVLPEEEEYFYYSQEEKTKEEDVKYGE